MGQRTERRLSEFRLSRGVLTDPRSIAEYEHSCPGAGKRILDEFFASTEKQRQFREKMQLKTVEADIESDRAQLQYAERGQKIALAIVSMCLGVVIWLCYIKQPILAGVIGGSTMLSLVSAFVYGRKKQAEERIAEVKDGRPAARVTPPPGQPKQIGQGDSAPPSKSR